MLESWWVAAPSNEESIRRAPAVLVITEVLSRAEAEFGERALRCVFLVAGYVAQNLLLQAVALEMGGIPIGAFRDGVMSEVLDLPPGEMPLYLIPNGYPEEKP